MITWSRKVQIKNWLKSILPSRFDGWIGTYEDHAGIDLGESLVISNA